MVKKPSIEQLGEKKYAKRWLVRIDDIGIDGLVFFYVFSAESPGRGIRTLRGYILEARVQKLNEGLIWVGDISHTSSSSYLDRLPASFQPSPTSRRIHYHSDEDINWENRGIGKLLISYIEKWAEESGFNTEFCFLSPPDDIKKLKHFYSKCGWEIRIFNEDEKRTENQNFYIGKVVKHLM